MENDVITPAAESSPQPVEVPTEPAAYQEWRQTGQVKPKAESAPAKQSSDTKPVDAGEGEGDQASGKAAASETEKKTEHKSGKAEARLNELLEDLRRAGLSPSELKTFKREAAKAADATDKPKETPEPTEKPAVDEKAPKYPKEGDFKTWEEFRDAERKYFEEMADFKAQKALDGYRTQQRQEAAQKEMTERLNQAKTRYGAEADQTIISAAKEVFQGKAVPAVIREVLNESPVLVDLLYTLGSKPEELAEFIDLCQSKPGQALRKAVLIEKLVSEELAKGSTKSEKTDTDRDDSGKFTSSKKKETKAPPPPTETSGRSGPPLDEVEGAIKANDFAAYRAATNRREILARKGQ